MAERSKRLSAVAEWLEARVNLTEIFSLLSIFGLFYTAVDTSKPFSQALREALAKPVPDYARWPRVLGLLTLILFLLEVLTGGLLAFYYRPTESEAYSSLLMIVRDVNFGWFVRQIHFWGAQVLLVVVVARMLRFFFRGIFQAPREVIWMASAGMFVIGTHLDFTGRLLTWSNARYWSGLRALEMLYSIPVIGPFFSFFLGGTGVGEQSLIQFYFLHIVILPLIFWALLYFNFAGIRRVGLSGLAGEVRESGRSVFRAHLYNLAILLVLIFGILVTLSVLWPVPFGQPADPYQTAVSPLPWYLLAPYGLVEFLPHWMPLAFRSGLLLLILVVFVGWPFFARFLGSPPSRRLLVLFGGAVFVIWLFLSFYGHFVDARV